MPRHTELFAVALVAASSAACTPICSFDDYACFVDNMAVYDRDGYELESFVVDSSVVVDGLPAPGESAAGSGPRLTSAPGPLVFNEDDPVVKLTMTYENPMAGASGASSGTNGKPLAGFDKGPIVGWGCFGIPRSSSPAAQLPVSRALATMYTSPETDSPAPQPDDTEGELNIQIEFDFELYIDEVTFDLDLIPFVLTEGGDDLEAALEDVDNLVLGPVTTLEITRIGNSDSDDTSGGSSGAGTTCSGFGAGACPNCAISACVNGDASACWYESSDGGRFDCAGCECTAAAEQVVNHCCPPPP